MKIRMYLVMIVVLFLTFTVSADAQEISVPIDAEGKLNCIDLKVERQLALFTEYQNFRQACLFQVSDTSYVLEISYQPEDRLLKTRLPLSLQEAEQFRARVTERIKMFGPAITMNQEGRARLLRGILVLSMGYYGWALPVTMDVNDGRAFAAIYMLTSGGSFFAGLSATRNVDVTDGAATFSLYGATRGIVHGMFLYGLAKGDDASGRGMVGFGLLGSLSEATAFFAIADRAKMSEGTARVMGVGGDFGLGLGLGAAHLAGFFDDDEEERGIAAGLLVGSAAGLMAGKFLANSQPYTRGDAQVLRGAGLLGAYIPLAIVDLVEPDEDRVYTATAMAGSIVGLGLGHHLVRGKDFTTGQGTLINLGGLAGGFVGLGIAYVVTPEEEDDNGAWYLASSAIGAAGGFWLLYRTFADDARTYGKRSSWNIRIVPEGLLAWAMRDKFSSATELSVPLTQVEFRF